MQDIEPASATERLLEISQILAAGLLRAYKKKTPDSTNQESNLGLDICPAQSVHGPHNEIQTCVVQSKEEINTCNIT